MTKNGLIQQLEQYQSWDNGEETNRLAFLFFLRHADNNYGRNNLAGHVTGSCFLLNGDGAKTLFMHHAATDQWFKMGGHCDGSEDVLAAALREGSEESGISKIRLVKPTIFDVDIHAIQARPEKNEPAHLHYDICYLCQTDSMDVVQNDESLALAWLSPDEALQKQNKPHYQRMVAKWRALKI